MALKKAERVQLRARVALEGPAGAGKTYSAMSIMSYLVGGGDWAFIDTENDSALRYAAIPGKVPDPAKGTFDFWHLPLKNHAPASYMAALKEVQDAGLKGVVIDSYTHAWSGGKNGVLAQKNKIDAAGGNSYINWGKVTPLHDELVAYILECPFHVIACMRSKAEIVIEEVTKNGRTSTVPRKVGTKPDQREDVDFEFDVVMMMQKPGNIGLITKSRYASFEDGAEWVKPGLEFAEALSTELNTGAVMPIGREEFIAQMKASGFEDTTSIAAFVGKHPQIGGVYKYDLLLEQARASR